MVAGESFALNNGIKSFSFSFLENFEKEKEKEKEFSDQI